MRERPQWLVPLDGCTLVIRLGEDGRLEFGTDGPGAAALLTPVQAGAIAQALQDAARDQAQLNIRLHGTPAP